MTAASTPQYKAALARDDAGACMKNYSTSGAPWFWIRNDETGKSEPFFGSDRWAHIWDFFSRFVSERGDFAKG